MTQTPSLKTQLLQVGGMDCGSCAKTIEASLQKLLGVNETLVSFATGRLSISYDPKLVDEAAIRDRITNLGYTVDVATSIITSAPNSDYESQAQSVTKKTDSDLTGWRFWLHNRRGQRMILSGLGLVLGLVTQQLELLVWYSRTFYGTGMGIGHASNCLPLCLGDFNSCFDC